MNRIYIIFLVFILSLIGFLIYNKFDHLNLIVKFSELEPFEKQLPVYYRGFKVGNSTRIYPDKHYKYTYVKLQVYPANVELPKNIRARVQQINKKDFINLIAPEDASVILLKNGDMIDGEISKDINKLLSDKLSSGGLDDIFNESTTLMESANVTVKNLGELFAQINSILTDVRGDIILASSNLAKTTTNLENISANLNTSLDKESMSNSVDNIEKTTENIKIITDDIKNITEQIDKATVPIVNSVLCQTNSTMKNANEITGGIKNTLKKHMGLGKVLFGKPISNECK